MAFASERQANSNEKSWTAVAMTASRTALCPARPEASGMNRMIRARLSAATMAAALSVMLAPQLAWAQASPFMTGATALQSNILAWLTPIAVILVMALGAMAMANRMSWGWCIGAILGIAIAFGAPQIVTWVRGMFGV
ncbi:MAG TPA: TrbC/VirB2 family protein [Steroidobacteraceae bacterium]